MDYKEVTQLFKPDLEKVELALRDNFLSDIPASDVQIEVYQRMKTARENLERLLPSSFEKTVHEIEEKVAKKLR